MQTETIPALLYERYQKTPTGIAHYTLDSNGKWQPHSWKDYYSEVSRLACGLKNLGLAKGMNIGIMAPASMQWDIVQMAIFLCGGVVVGLDPHDAEENINSIAQRADLSGLVAGELMLLEKIDAVTRSRLEFIIILDKRSASDRPVEGIERINDILPEEPSPIGNFFETVKETDPATIIFTSGTTGTPKGIQYTHGQVVLACASILEAFNDIREESNLVCWLPLSNLYQRIINYCAIIVGASTYYVENPRDVLKYLPEINPHIFLGVPRFYEKLYAGIQENISQRPTMLRFAVCWALKLGAEYGKRLRKDQVSGIVARISYQAADFLILRRLRNIMGSNLQYMISGSAPISRWLLEQFHGMGFLILEAYGISENIIPIAANRPDSFKFGTVGRPLSGNELKSADDGELLAKGPGVFFGYYNDDDMNSPFTEDGFLATGDYAAFDEEGFLVITGRKSEIFKTSTGRRVSPVKIEELLGRLPYVEHAVIYGAGKPFLVALLSLDIERLKESSTLEKTIKGDETGNILDEWNNMISSDVLNQVDDLQNFLHPAGLLVMDKPFTVEGGELTANLKVRRKAVLDNFQMDIVALYQDIFREQKNKTDNSGRPDKLVIHWL